MRHGSLFSGIGGFDLASEWMGWTNVFHCEINEFCRKVLKQHFPDAATYTDITTTDFSEWQGRCDIVTGGFPCQPYSQAGKRKGKADDRHLWPEMLRAIKQIQPTWVVGENVPGLLNWERGMVLAEIYADLEAAGFEVFPPVILPACGKNAPHRRDRLWVVAYSKNIDAGGIKSEYNQQPDGEEKWKGLRNQFTGNGQPGITTNSIGKRLESIECQPIDNGEKFQAIKRGYNWWQVWPTQPPICGGDDGISNRVDRIKALGNAIVPQVAFEIFKAIEEIEKI